MWVPRVLFLCLLLATPALARAAGDDANEDTATVELIQQGIGLRRAGKDEAALAVFLEAERHAPDSVRVLLHVTTAAQATGRWLLAYQYLQKASAYRNEAYYQRYRASIRSIEEAVAQRVGQFRAIGTPSGAEVLLNGEVIGTLPMESPKVVEVGSYLLEVRKAGYFPLQRPLNIAAGASLSQEAVELKVNDQLGSTREDARLSPLTRRNASTPERSPLRARWITWTLAGSSLALFATSGTAFVIRENEAKKWNDDDRCLDAGSPLATREQLCGDIHSRAKLAERVGIVTGVMGIAFGGAAIVHWLSSSERSTSERARARLPACAAGLGSIVCRGTF